MRNGAMEGNRWGSRGGLKSFRIFFLQPSGGMSALPANSASLRRNPPTVQPWLAGAACVSTYMLEFKMVSERVTAHDRVVNGVDKMEKKD